MTAAILRLRDNDMSITIDEELGFIFGRRSIRVYAPGEVSEAMLAKLLEAAMFSAAARFRPILMTSLATMLGALPIALALGGSAKSRVSMGIVVIGGLFFSLVLTLFVIPAMYTFFSKEKKEDVSPTHTA